MENPSTMPRRTGFGRCRTCSSQLESYCSPLHFRRDSRQLPRYSFYAYRGIPVILGVAFRAGKSGTRTPVEQLLYWAPRVLCIVTAIFISLFALDVFNEGKGFWGRAVALLIHLIPTFLILVVLSVSWRREWIGGVLFPRVGGALRRVGLEHAVRPSSTFPIICRTSCVDWSIVPSQLALQK